MTFGGASPSAVPAPGSSSWGSSAPANRSSQAAGRRSAVRALIGGVEVAVVGAVVWGVVAYVTKHQYSLIALAVGMGIGYMVSRSRRGDPVVAAAAAVLALLGCALGTFVALLVVASRDGAGLSLGVIIRAYPNSVGSLGIVFWLMAAVAAFTYPMGVHTGRAAQPVPDQAEPEPSPRPPWAVRPAPGGYGAPQAPSGQDDDAESGAPGLGLVPEPAAGSAMVQWNAPPAPAPTGSAWEGQPAASQMPTLAQAAEAVTAPTPAPRRVVQPVAGQMPGMRPAAQPVAGQMPRRRRAAQPMINQMPAMPPAAQPVTNQMPAMPPAGQPVTNQMPAMPPAAQPMTNQMPAMRPAVQPITGQMPALRPSAQPQGWDLQPSPKPKARHRAPQAASDEPTTGQWAAGPPPAGGGGGEGGLPKRQRSVGRHSRPWPGQMG